MWHALQGGWRRITGRYPRVEEYRGSEVVLPRSEWRDPDAWMRTASEREFNREQVMMALRYAIDGNAELVDADAFLSAYARLAGGDRA